MLSEIHAEKVPVSRPDAPASLPHTLLFFFCAYAGVRAGRERGARLPHDCRYRTINAPKKTGNLDIPAIVMPLKLRRINPTVLWGTVGLTSKTAMRPEMHIFVSLIVIGGLFVAVRLAMRHYFPLDT